MSDAAKRQMIDDALRSGRRISPSFNDLWHGTPAAGSRWTVQQMRTMEADGRNPARTRTYQVPLLIQNRTDWALPPEVTHVLCPLIAMAKNGLRVLVITPCGDKKWTDAKARGWTPAEH